MFSAIKGGNTTEALEQAVMQSLGVKPDDEEQESTIIRLHATHSVLTKMRIQEIRFDYRWTIAHVKAQFHYRFGSLPADQTLQLKDGSGELLVEMVDDTQTLQHYGAESDWTIHVIDSNPLSQLHDFDFDDLSKVEKYVMSEDDYSQRTNTFRKFKEEQLKKNPNFMKAQPQPVVDFQKEEAAALVEGQRCETLAAPAGRRGTIKYIGKIPGLGAGYWVGIALDDATGNTNGTVVETAYFECAPDHGVFLRPKEIQVGDFPLEDQFDEEEDMI